MYVKKKKKKVESVSAAVQEINLETCTEIFMYRDKQ
jgi:hypothetical protein